MQIILGQAHIIMEELINNNNNIKIMHSSTRLFNRAASLEHRVNTRYQSVGQVRYLWVPP
jgi:hypothetical protein